MWGNQGLDNDIRDTILYRSLHFLGFANDIDIIGHLTQMRYSKNWIQIQCNENEVPVCRRLKPTGK